jgi:predicted GNAT superfamily acetyltransferase
VGTVEEDGVKAARRMKSRAESGIEVRHCHGLAEYEQCMELERVVWGSGEIDVVPSAVFVVVAEAGGQVLGAFDREAGCGMVGFCLALAAFRGEQRYLHSHMTAVVPEYQNRGIGRMLKLFQRADALERGIELVEWTFDPLEVRNAYFNLVRLGAIARRFLPNVYGITTSPLHSGLPTDRLVAEWWLRSARVLAAVEAGKAEPRERSPRSAGAAKAAASIFVPKEIVDWRKSDPRRAAECQAQVREGFQHWMSRGYAVTGLELNAEGGNYLLTPWDAAAGDAK